MYTHSSTKKSEGQRHDTDKKPDTKGRGYVQKVECPTVEADAQSRRSVQEVRDEGDVARPRTISSVYEEEARILGQNVDIFLRKNERPPYTDGRHSDGVFGVDGHRDFTGNASGIRGHFPGHAPSIEDTIDGTLHPRDQGHGRPKSDDPTAGYHTVRILQRRSAQDQQRDLASPSAHATNSIADGRLHTDDAERHCDVTPRYSDLLRGQDEGVKVETLSAGYVCHNPTKQPAVVAEAECKNSVDVATPEDHQVDNRNGERPSPTDLERQSSLGTFRKSGQYGGSDCSCGEGRDTVSVGFVHGQAPRGATTVSGNNGAISERQNGVSIGNTNALSHGNTGSRSASSIQLNETSLKQQSGAPHEDETKRYQGIRPTSNRVTSVPRTPEERSAPLHCPSVLRQDLDRLASQAKQKKHLLYAKLDKDLKWNSDVKLYEHIIRDVVDPVSFIEANDLEVMLAAGIIRPIHEQDVKSVGMLFFVYEHDKHRRRIILWPKNVNDQIHYEASFSLRSFKKQLLALRRGDYAAKFDLTAAYYQVPLAPEVQPYYSFKTQNGEFYCFTVSVMGARPTAELMQTITMILASINDANTAVQMEVVIDGVLYTGREKDVQRAAHIFKQNCEEFRAEYKENAQENNPHQIGVWCGMGYNLKEGTAFIPEKIHSKLVQDGSDIFDETLTLRRFLGVMGHLFHAGVIVKLNWAKYFHILKFYRRKMSAFSKGTITLESPIKMWSILWKDWYELYSEVWKFSFFQVGVSHERENSSVTLYTDASDSGWGAVLLYDGIILETGERWDAVERKRHISEKEMVAVEKAATAFRDVLKGKHINLLIDNTTVIGVLRRGYSAHFHLNKHVAAVLQRLHATSYDIEYVSSALNMADGASRR